jgi:hypothetical protein
MKSKTYEKIKSMHAVSCPEAESKWVYSKYGSSFMGAHLVTHIVSAEIK